LNFQCFPAFFADGIATAWHSTETCMVDALFSSANYVAAKKTLDAVALRQEAIASNIANLETPGYKRIDLAPSFQAELQRACASGDSEQVAMLQPSLAPDPSAVAQSQDGNTVSLEQEMSELNQNALLHTLETQLVSNTLYRLKLAITGKS
jgi:flagellar basal-body rod protein FlgB